MSPNAEAGGNAPVRRFGRGKLLVGAVGAALGSLVGRTGSARAQDQPGTPLLLGTENLAADTTSLAADAAGPVLELVHPGDAPALVASSLLPQQVGFTDTLHGVALAGFGPSAGVLGTARPPLTVTAPAGSVGVLGRAFLPEQQPGISAVQWLAGVGGVASEHGLGVVGVAGPDVTTITQTAGRLATPGSGVAGVGGSSGVEGRTLLPQGATISITAELGRGVVGISSGLGVLGLSRRSSMTVSDETLRRAGAAGFGDEIGVWGSAGLPLPPSPSLTMTVGVLGTAEGPDAAAIVAENPTGVALRVLGAAEFKSGGTGIVPRRATSARVEDPTVGPGSLVNVTLAGDPGNASTVHYVAVGEGFLVVHLTVPPRFDTPFGYFVFQGCR